MAYNTKKMLEDVNGDLIPQYYDPVADEFKPLTNDPRDVRLTGSIVDYFYQNINVDPGATVIIDEFQQKLKSFRIGTNLSGSTFTFVYDATLIKGEYGLTNNLFLDSEIPTEQIGSLPTQRASNDMKVYGSHVRLKAKNTDAVNARTIRRLAVKFS